MSAYSAIDRRRGEEYLGAGTLPGLVVAAAVLLAWAVPSAAQVITPALTGQSCAGTRFGSNLNCTSNDFTALVNFTQPPGGIETCIAGEFITVDVIGDVQSNSPIRYDGAIFVGESGNDPRINDAGQSCSLGVFPASPFPFQQIDGDACGDFAATSSVSWEITGARVRCQAAPGSNTLAIPYTLVFDNLSKPACAPSNVTAGTTAKCITNTGAGLTGVTVLGFVNLTKQTSPDGEPQSFSFTSTASSGQTPQWTLADTPTDQTLVDGQTKRISVPLSVTGGNVTLTITEDATTFWEPGVTISCAAAPGAAGNPATFNNATRTITANLTNANFGADCTITNTKRSRVTIAKGIVGRAAPTDQFTVSATGGGTLTDDAGSPVSAPVSVTTSGAATSAQTTFWSQPGQALTITDAAASGSLANYSSTYACTNATAGSGTAMPSGTGTSFALTPAAGDDITCTFTNTSLTASLTLAKTWEDATPGDAVSVTATGLAPLASIADTANETDTAAPQTVTRGTTLTLAETFTTGDPAEYSSSLACTGTSGLSGSTLTVGPADSAIVCTFTNALIPAPAWALDKTTASTPSAAGETITYAFSLTNTGNVAISGISVTDPLLPGLSCTLASLSPGETTSCAATGNVYTVTQADVDAGSVVNTATAAGTPAAGSLADATDSVTVTITAGPALTVAKADPVNADGDGSGTVTINDVLTYTVTASNSGNVTLNNVVVSDPLLSPATTSCATLAPGVTCVLTGTYTVVLADVTAGQIENTATADSDETTAVTDTVTTPTFTLPILAGDDAGSAGGVAGGTAVANVLANDTLGGAPVDAADVTLSEVSSTSPNVTLEPATGAVSVAAGTAAGSYTLVYQVCENLNPANCDTANVAVTVTAASIAANDDAGSAGGVAGGTAVANVLANDTLGGAPVDAADVTLSEVSSTSPNVTLEPATGAVSVAPDTAAGSYTLVYQVCENLNPANCDTANVAVTVTAASIAANDDAGSAGGVAGGTAVANVLANDTLGGAPVDAADVTLSEVSSTSPNVTLEPATGAVSVAPDTAAGSYTLVYQVCENLNPANCDTANVAVTVSAASIAANDDAGSAGGVAGGTAVANVLANDTLGGAPVDAADVTLSEVSSASPNVSLDPATGAVSVAPDTAAGSYTLVYQVCENLNPANCDTANVTVTVSAASVAANDDSGSVGGVAGGTAVADVLANDTLAGAPVDAADVTLTEVSSTSPNVSLDPATGAVSVAPDTAAGSYTLIYQLCENLNPANCDTANVAVTVTAATVVATPDSRGFNGFTGGTAPVSVLANDTLAGAPVDAADVTLTEVSSTSPEVSLDPASGWISVAAGTPAGTYTLIYQVCENLNPANCDTAPVTVTVTAGPIVAGEDSGGVGGVGGGTAVADVLANDTLGGAPIDPVSVTLTQVSSTSPAVTLDPATGAVSVAPGTAAGTYTLVYQVCEILNPTNCDTASATVTVGAATVLANADAGSVGGADGGTAVANVLANDTLGGAPLVPSDVTLTEVSRTSPNVTLDAATGAVSVAPGTEAGTYTLVYQLCENLNPSNCDSTAVTVTVTAAAVLANDDTGSVNGAAGGSVGPVVLANDTLGGAPVDPADVTLTEVSSTSPNVALDPATGVVSVAPGTAAGTYTLIYQLCENLNPANCDTASVTATVSAGTLAASPDARTVNGSLGGTAPPSVLQNDSLDGLAIDPAEVSLSQVSSTDPGVALDTATGQVSAAPGTAAGTYTLVYQVCENLNPTNCDTASVTVTVSAAGITANDDGGTAGGIAGGAAVANVTANDRLGGAPVILADVTLSQVSTSNPNVTLDPGTGTVSVAPGTAAGTYTLVYQLCENLNPANCDTASVTVTVSAAGITANDDGGTAGGIAGGAAVANVTANDRLGGAPVMLADVTLSQVSTSNPNVTLDPGTGAVTVAPGTAAGTYTLVYQLCENLNPTNCDTASVTVTVGAASIVANGETASVGGAAGGTAVANVLANDTLGGAPVDAADVTLSQVSTTDPNVTLDPATGAVTVAPGTPAGTYTVVYEVCEALNPTNCDTAGVTVIVAAAALSANADSGTTGGAAGGTAIANVLANDTLDGAAVDAADVTLSQVSTTDPNVTLDPATGAVTVAPGTPAGTYTVVYEVCEALNPTNCDTASVSAVVTAASITASDDSGSADGTADSSLSPGVLVNDTLNGAPVNLADVTLTQVSTTDPGVTLDAGTGVVSVAAGTAAGTYTLVYQLCENLNPANCDTASVSVEVTAATIVANPDSRGFNGFSGGTAPVSVLSNDTLNGAPVDPADVTLTEVSSTSPSVSLDPATGWVSVTPGTPAGTYTLVYEFCENLNPANCDSASVAVSVAAGPILAGDDSGSRGGIAGGAAVASVLANDSLGGAPVDPADVTLTEVSSTSPGVTLDPATGAVNVAPGTAAGTYTLVYQLCEDLNPANCDTASVVVDVTAASISANDDSGSVTGAPGGVAVPNVLADDTLGGAPVGPGSVTLAQVSTSSPDVGLDPATGAVSVAPGTPAGTVTLVYEVCEILNPANCDTGSVTVVVDAAPLVVVPDERSIDVSAGGTVPPSVLDNDTLGGEPIDPADVTLTQVSSTSPEVGIDPVTGEVVVAPGTPAGTYTVVYQVCEVLNPGNCGTAAVTVTVTATELVAAPDDRSVDGSLGGTAPPSVLGNDTIGGAPVDPADVTLSQVSSTSPNLALDPTTGQVGAAPGTPAGSYTVVYEVCEAINPTNCDRAPVNVTVTAAELLASDDSGSVDGGPGGAAGPSVLANDTLGGAPVDPTDVTLSEVSSTSPGVSLDPATGSVTVAPGTPAGTYTVVYQVCEVLNPANCDTASATVTVTPAPIVANPDTRSIGGLVGGAAVPSVLANDTLGGAPVDPADVILSQVSSGSPNVALDPASGEVTVAPGTPAGTYTLVYEFCEALNPANCAQGAVTVNATAAPVIANADAGSVGGVEGGTAIPTVLGNDTLNGAPVPAGSVTLTQVSASDAAVALDTASGAVTVAAGTPAGVYPLVYQFCENLNPTNCATATATVRVTAGSLVARPDSGTLPDGDAGGVAIESVLENDTLAGVPVEPDTVTLGQVSSSSPLLTLDTSTGAVNVSPGIPAGTYSVVYEICEVVNPANCAVTTATVVVAVDQQTPIAVDDSFTGGEGAPVTGDLAANDTPGNQSGTYALVTGSGPANGSVEIDPAGTFEYEAEPGFVGTDSFDYEVCDADGDCATATVRVTITPDPGKLRVQKSASSGEVGAVSLVAFTVTLTNVSGLPVRDAELLDQPPRGLSLVAGSVEIEDEDGVGEVEGAGPFTVSGIDVPAGGTATVRYLMRVSAGLPEGEYTNRAVARQLGAAISNTAAATVRLASGADPVTEQVRVLGKVFDDRNGDGWQDEGERGIPGVRLATVEGLVAETDAYGRFRFEGLTATNSARGQNFIVKVDPATLPAGSRFTTENPLIRRITQGLPARFDFGVRLPSSRSGSPAGAEP